MKLRFVNASDMTLDQLLNAVAAWNSPFLFSISYTSKIAPDANMVTGIGQRDFLYAFSYSGKIYTAHKGGTGWTEIPYAHK